MLTTENIVQAAGIVAVVAIMLGAGLAILANELRRRDEGEP